MYDPCHNRRSLLLLALLVFSCGTAPQVAPAAASIAPPAPALPAAPLPPARIGGSENGQPVSIPEVTERVLPSVVNIASTRKRVVQPGPFPFEDPFFRHFFGPRSQAEPRQREEQGLGSGVIVAEGLVVTNNHVVENADVITITTNDRREFEAEIVGTDPKSDLAVLRIKGDVSTLVPIAWGRSGDLRLGDTVLAIGNPFGVGQTVTMGIVSAIGRADLGIVDYEDFIQTDAAINPGNSGGALVNTRGELVGINTAILSRTGGSMGIGFAIPTDMARPIMAALRADGRVIRGWLGVSIQNVDQDMAVALGLSSAGGVLVSDVAEDTPASAGGLKRGDVIIRVNEHAVTSTGDLRNTIATAGAGRTVALQVIREGKEQRLEIRLGEMPSDPEAKSAIPDSQFPAKKVEIAGLSLEPLTPSLRQRLGVPTEFSNGVAVTAIAPGSAAASAGLAPGDVVLQINGKPVVSIERFSRDWKANKKNKLLLIYRAGRTIFTLVKP